MTTPRPFCGPLRPATPLPGTRSLLAAFPDLAARLDVQRVPFPRPRLPVIAAVGEANQALPVLVLGDDPPPPADAAVHEGVRFVLGSGRILELLAERHGFPRLHS